MHVQPRVESCLWPGQVTSAPVSPMLRRLRRLHRLFKANSHCKPWPVTHCTETSQKFVQNLRVFARIWTFGHVDTWTCFHLAIFASATHRFLMNSSWAPDLRRLYPSHWSCSKDSCYWPRFSMVQVHKQDGKSKSDQYVGSTPPSFKNGSQLCQVCLPGNGQTAYHCNDDAVICCLYSEPA